MPSGAGRSAAETATRYRWGQTAPSSRSRPARSAPRLFSLSRRASSGAARRLAFKRARRRDRDFDRVLATVLGYVRDGDHARTRHRQAAVVVDPDDEVVGVLCALVPMSRAQVGAHAQRADPATAQLVREL